MCDKALGLTLTLAISAETTVSPSRPAGLLSGQRCCN